MPGDKVVVLDMFGTLTGIQCTVPKVEAYSVGGIWGGYNHDRPVLVDESELLAGGLWLAAIANLRSRQRHVNSNSDCRTWGAQSDREKCLGLVDPPMPAARLTIPL